MTVVEPSVSTAFIRRIIALCLAMLRMPNARVMTRIIGKPSGTMATKMAIAIINWSIAASQISMLGSPYAIIISIDTNRTATINAINPRNLPSDSNLSSNGVFGVSELAISLAILPSWVSIPVETTTPTALPDATQVPINAIFLRSAKSVSSGSKSTFFCTVNDSPVSADSSILHWNDSNIRISAGTLSPSYKFTMSPGTNSDVAISISESFLTTTH